MKQNPRITVLIPVFNGERFIEEAIDSVLIQEGVSVKIVVSDNCSTDRTAKLVDTYDDERISLVRNNSHLPIFAHFKRSLEFIETEFSMVLCADDFLMSSDALISGQAVMDQNPSVVAIFSDIDYVGADRKTIAHRKFRVEGPFDPVSNFKASIVANRNMFGIPILFRRDPKVNFDDSLSYMADLDFAYRLGYRGQFYYLPRPLMANRYHRNNQTWRYFHRSYSELNRLANKHSVSLSLEDRVKMFLNWIFVAAQKFAFRLYCTSVIDRLNKSVNLSCPN